MKNIFRSILFLAIGSFLSFSAYSQGSGSTGTTAGTSQSHSYNPDFGRPQPTSFEVTRTVKGNLVKVEKGRLFLKTKKGEVLNLKITAKTKITSKKNDESGLTNAKFIRVSYLAEVSKTDEREAVRIKVLN